MACKGICIRHRAPSPVGSGRYFSGQKRCQVCNIFIVWEELWCPCCGFRLRTKPHNSSGKQTLTRIRIRTKHQQQQTRNRREGERTSKTLAFQADSIRIDRR
jgi:hypothetical protein